MGLQKNTEKTESLLMENYEKYYRLAYSYMRNEDDALDVVQESAYRAIKDCHKVRQNDYLSTWIYRIVVNVCIDTLRKRHHEAPSDTMPEHAFEDRYSELDLRDVLNRLDDKSRIVVMLRYFEDLKLDDIARITDENINTVKARLYRALKKLRLNLEAENYSGALEK